MSQNCNKIGSNKKANSRAVESFDSAALGRCNRIVALDCTRAAGAARTIMWNEENNTIVLPLIVVAVLVVVGRIHEDGTHQDVYLVGVVFDADSVAVEDAPLLADLANLDVALQDGKVPAHAIALDFVVVVTGDVDVDLFLGGHAPVFLLGGRPEFAVLEPFVVVPRGDRGCICLLQATQFFPANGLERSLVSPLERIALDLVDRATVLGDPVVVGDELELLFEMKFLNHF
ncbi:unnamed protein product [Pseudo-nitzschia multistriata]|uniref:Uncharacterized protein n=1 Tax=Pseudo-nitzschia multistriata TaxID=183589 RepID=A0A448YVL7_9STRA|nr:unnamed protein product [Pseudo-nitzschia multistriata]